MKKKSQSINQSFKMPHLFRDDLEDLENILKEVSPDNYKLETQNFEYKEVKEIPENLNATSKFNIQTYSPYINIDFNHFSARLYAGEDNIKTVGAVKKLIDVISKRERKILYWSSQLSIWIAPILAVFPIQILLQILLKTTKEERKLSFHNIWLPSVILLFAIAVIWWIVGYNSSLKKFSIIEFTSVKNRLTFLQRNKDQIILITFGALLGALVTVLFTKIF